LVEYQLPEKITPRKGLYNCPKKLNRFINEKLLGLVMLTLYGLAYFFRRYFEGNLCPMIMIKDPYLHFPRPTGKRRR